MKKIIALTLVFCMLFSLISGAIPALDTAEESNEAAILTGDGTETFKPGVNVFTGDMNAVTFETEADLSIVKLEPRWDKSAVIEYQIGERTAYNGIGKSLMFRNKNGKTDASGHFVTRITATLPVNVNRPVFVIARVCDAYTQWRSSSLLRSNTAGDWRKDEIKNAYEGDSVLNSDKFTIDVWSLDGNNYWMYLDNLAVIPYYQITYKNILPDRTSGNDIVKYELDTENITVSTDDGVIAGLPTALTPDCYIEAPEGYTLAGWSTEENSSVAMESVALANDDIVLYPIWVTGDSGEDEDDPVELVPGKNIFTGDTNAITFNTEADLKYVTVGPKWMANAVVDYEINSISGNGNMLRFKNTNGVTDASGHFVVKTIFTSDTVVDRPAYFIARVYDACTYWAGLGNDWMRTNLSGNWDRGYITRKLGIDSDINTNTFQVDAWAIYNNNYWMCIDNVAVIPYYEVTYKNILPDGTVGEDVVKYELDTEKIAVTNNDGVIEGLPSELTPSENLEFEGYTLLGWSLTEGADVVTPITLENKDIVLYPVWKFGEAEPEPEPEVPVKLTLADAEITTDGETVTLLPVLEMESGNILSDFTGMTVFYDIDNINVLPVKNEDGSLTVTGKMNGETNVGVSIAYEGKTFTASALVSISGQKEKAPANDIKLVTYGNSIMNHGPSEELSWTGNWGMAATSKDKDYVHQLISLLENKYGKGSVTHAFGQNNHGFESATNNATLDTDWETKLDGLSEFIAAQDPDIITIQYGENSQQGDEEIYEKALTAFVTELRKGAPDAVILVCTPYWSNTGMGTNIGSRATAEKLGIPLADVASLTHIPGSMATGLYEHSGVAAHPSDYGMKLIAEEMFAKLSPYLTDAIELNYTDVPDSIEFANSESTITTELGTLQLSVKVKPETAAQDVVFSSSDSDIATVDGNGLVTARNNGTVTITAVSKYSDSVKGNIEITVLGQTEPFTVTYDKNTDDEVTGMPDADTKAKYETKLSTAFPERKYYSFKGWSTEKDGKPIDSLYVTDDVTVYAIWENAYRWTFDRDGYSEGIVIENGFNQKIENGRFMAMATYTDESTGNVLTVKSPELSLESSEYASFTLSVQNTIINSATAIKVKIFTDTGTFEFEEDVASTNPAMYRFDLSELTGTITGFEIVPTNIDATIYVDEMFFNKKSVPGLNAFNGTEKSITFETDADLKYVSIVPSWDKNAIIDYQIGERTAYNGIGKSLMFRNTNGKTDASGHFVTKITASLPISVDRPALFIARVCDAYTQWRCSGTLRTNNASDWQKSVIKKELIGDAVLNSDEIAIQAWSLDGNSYWMYFDNLAVVPYYKVTYRNILPDGSDNGETVKYWLNVGNLDVSTNDGIIAGLPESYTPDEVIYSDGFRLSGWTTVEGSDKVMNEISLRNKDIVLYPVWEEYINFEMEIEGETQLYIDGNTAKYTPVFTANIPEKSVLWSVNNTEIAEIDENGCLTPYKDGMVTIKCTSVYNPDITAEITVNISYIEFEAEIIGADSIRKEYRSEKYRCQIVSGEIPVTAFIWSVDNKNLASISDAGVLVPYDNGTVTITATSVYNPNYSVSLEVELTGQPGAHTVTYMPGTNDGSVSGLPEPESAAGNYELSKIVPVRDGYIFVGWSKEEGKVDTIESLSVRNDTSVYAVWAKGFGMEFNGDRGLVTSVSNGKITESEEKLIVTTGASGDVRISFAELNLNPDEYKIVQIRMSVDKKNALQMFYKGEITENGEKKLYGYNENGFKDAETYSVERSHADEGLENWFVIDLNMYKTAPDAKASWRNGTADLIKNIWLDITNAPNSVVYIDYIRFISEMPEETVVTPNNGLGGNNSAPMEYPMDVEILTKPGTIGGNGEQSETNAIPLNFKDITDEIIVNFNGRENSGLFAGMRNAEVISIENSEISVKTSGSESSAAAFETYEIDLDADSHRYVILKAKSIDLTADKLRMYFVNDDEYSVYRSRDSKVVKIGGDYSMLIFDMSEFDKWNGNISRLLFSFIGKIEGTFKVDWVMFTNEIPSHMDDIEGVSSRFPTANKNAMTFEDVTENDWFLTDVAIAYRLGLINGVSENAYNPYGNVTLAEAATVAVRLNRIYNGEEALTADISEDAWYTPYINEAIEKGIIKRTQFTDYNVPATRKEVAQIIYKALPSSWYNAINVFDEIPDLDKSDNAFGAVIKLYEAGVVIGSDEKFNFLPETSITRAELAAVLGRCAVPDSRKRVVTDAERERLKKVYSAEDFAGTASLEGCTAYGFTIKDGFAWAKSVTADPIVYLKNLTGLIDGKVYRKITVGMKWDTEKVKSPNGSGCQMFFTTPEGGWSDSRKLTPKWDGKTNENGVGEFVFDLSSNSQTKGTITAMRFDPFDFADAEFAIEYIIIE